MGRVLLLGTAPLPVSGDVVASGPSIRTWQFARPIADAGHSLTVVALRPGNDEARVLSDTTGNGLRVLEAGTGYFQQMDGLEAMARKIAPDAILGVGTILPVWSASRLGHLAPVWTDIFGDPIIELQAKAQVYPDQAVDEDQFHIYRLLTTALRTADRFSGLSEAQGHALIGMLGLTGRLGGRTAGLPLVSVIPCGLDARAPVPDIAEHRDAVRTELGYDDTDFVVAWSGSYNTWMDGGALFEGLERAMDASPRIRFLSTGGGTPIYNEAIYGRFQERTEASPHRERYDLKGWVPKQEAERLQMAADIGINIDRWTYEAVLGSRSRILHMLHLGLPVASTCICELTRDLRDTGGLFEFGVAAPDDLARLLTELADGPRERLTDSARRGQRFVREHYDFARTVADCLKWLEAPKRAADRPDGRNDAPDAILRYGNDEALRERVAELETRPRGLREALGKWVRKATGGR